MDKPYQKQLYIIMIILTVSVIALLFSGYFIYIVLPYKEIGMQIEGDWPIEVDSLIGFTAAKNASTFRRDVRKDLAYHVFRDNRGARVNTSNQENPQKVTIMTVGCSFSLGHGMENKSTFTEILRRRLGVPVANFALNSYATLQSLQMLERNADLKPKVIIYAFIKDHIRRNLSPCAPSYTPFCFPVSYVDFDEQGSPYIHRPQMGYYQELNKKFYEYVILGNFGFDDIIWGVKITLFRLTRSNRLNYSNDSVSRQKSMSYLMNKIIEVAKSIDAVLIVMYIPKLKRGKTKPPPPELLNSLNRDAIFIDLVPTVIQYYSNPKNPSLRFANDSHPNRLAHELMAREIERVLRRENIF